MASRCPSSMAIPELLRRPLYARRLAPFSPLSSVAESLSPVEDHRSTQGKARRVPLGGDEGDNDSYTLVGKTYLHGFMDGEAKQPVNGGRWED
ncbi:hypothetical protein DL766_004473 [Monosporascus sp. MC13-8B]|uniref:Uncharacterized protein n=1 Tax=Monosporascus cannonballus TaxID=155416 RepID=A0ABY0H2H6_9PEZI|nr:hypothetical protein DL762_006306 [Monosporascus cannonballus]RYP01398.1 hypothetical protein DL763_000208 [Monosporascus cannonballus]RYP31290.1 hypothetical protein DL766_004473 [Monosporascus sp. MC13-8B]